MTKILSISSVLFLMPLVTAYAFAPKISFSDKCKKSDIIVQGEVISVVDLFPERVPSDKSIIKDGGIYHNPTSVAVFRIHIVINGDHGYANKVILIPCGYDSEYSPSELTNSRKYILFLKQMGNSYFHPLAPSCTHVVLNDKVGLSGLDWEGDFDPQFNTGKSMSLQDFIKDIKNAILAP